MSMLFDTEDGRDLFFRLIEADFLAIRFGSAIEHAASTNAGIWGDEALLFFDCSRMMLAEVNRYAFEQTGDWGFAELSQVVDCNQWHRLYEAARKRRQEELGRVLHDLAVRADNEYLRRLAQGYLTHSILVGTGEEPPYSLVYRELAR